MERAVLTLTGRELQVLEAIRAGAHTYGAISRRLEPAVSPRTVQDIVHTIAEKIPPDPSPPLIRVILYAYRVPYIYG